MERRLCTFEATRIDTNIFSNKKPQHTRKVSTLQSSSSISKKGNTNGSQSQNVSKQTCKCCSKGSHAIRKCYKFRKLQASERLNLIKTLGYCTNCLSYSHEIEKCASEGRCGEKHNSLLCQNTRSVENNGISIQNSQGLDSFPPVIPSTSDGRFTRPQTYTTLVSENVNVIFPTSLVRVLNCDGNYVVLRAMIDVCSDASYITEVALKKLKLPMKKVNIQVSGLGDTVTSESKGLASFMIESLVNRSFTKNVNTYVLSLISPNRPFTSFHSNMIIPRNIQLADPNFNKSSKIDLLLGGDVDCAIYKSGSSKYGNIIFRETELGWISSRCVRNQLNCFATTLAFFCS